MQQSCNSTKLLGHVGTHTYDMSSKFEGHVTFKGCATAQKIGIAFRFQWYRQYIKILLVCPCVCDGCGRGRNKFAGRVQNHHVR